MQKATKHIPPTLTKMCLFYFPVCGQSNKTSTFSRPTKTHHATRRVLHFSRSFGRWYNTLHFASKECAKGIPFGNPKLCTHSQNNAIALLYSFYIITKQNRYVELSASSTYRLCFVKKIFRKIFFYSGFRHKTLK